MARIESGVELNKDEHHNKMKNRMQNMDTKPYLLNIPASLHKKVKRKLVEEERTLRDVLIDCLYKYINQETKKS